MERGVRRKLFFPDTRWFPIELLKLVWKISCGVCSSRFGMFLGIMFVLAERVLDKFSSFFLAEKA